MPSSPSERDSSGSCERLTRNRTLRSKCWCRRRIAAGARNDRDELRAQADRTGGHPRVFYLDDRERTLDSPIDKVMLAVTAFADELKRVKDGQTVYDKVAEKACRGHVVGGVVFGYDNIPVVGPTGKRSHVERVINQSQAAVVRRVFAESAAGTGFARLAKLLNAEKAAAPKLSEVVRPAGPPRPYAWF